jgi:hypothetical protein
VYLDFVLMSYDHHSCDQALLIDGSNLNQLVDIILEALNSSAVIYCLHKQQLSGGGALRLDGELESKRLQNTQHGPKLRVPFRSQCLVEALAREPRIFGNL